MTSGISGERGNEDYYYKGYQGAYIPKGHHHHTHRPPPPRQPAAPRPPHPEGELDTRMQALGDAKRPISKGITNELNWPIHDEGGKFFNDSSFSCLNTTCRVWWEEAAKMQRGYQGRKFQTGRGIR